MKDQLSLFPHLRSRPQMTHRPAPHKVTKRVGLSFLSKRTYAFGIDLFLIFLLHRGLLSSYYNFFRPYFENLPFTLREEAVPPMEGMAFILSIVVYIGYFFASMVMTNGQTPGKMIFGLRVVCPQNKHDGPSLFRSLQRASSYFICHFFGVFLLGIPYLSQSKKGIPDWLSQTFVMHDDEYKAWLSRSVLMAEADRSASQLDLLEDAPIYPLHSQYGREQTASDPSHDRAA